MNVDRINANLRADPYTLKVWEQLVGTDVVIDTAADITPIHRTTKLRYMQLRLLIFSCR